MKPEYLDHLEKEFSDIAFTIFNYKKLRPEVAEHYFSFLLMKRIRDLSAMCETVNKLINAPAVAEKKRIQCPRCQRIIKTPEDFDRHQALAHPSK